ncbi:hypothetical protein LCGC14_1425200 [marine sediment metagenome]|uniref:Uncharacterized protein n=1 Tax=marine sediment metagenome TaxID=412755 RepID=A0A0F9M5P2_9ZZZZ
MPNSRLSSDYYEYATVNTNPGASGYFTNEVNIRQKSLQQVFFSVRETGASSAFSVTITLQFKCPGDDDWQDYDTYSEVNRKLIEGGGAGVRWRMGVEQGDYTSGEVTFGFDW